jgi:diacylglycerol kinase (ATP)
VIRGKVMNPVVKEVKRLIKALGYSWAGLKAAHKNEAAFRLECILAIILIPAGMFLGQNWVERSLLAGAPVALMIIELVNSAIEAVVNRIGTEHHTLSGQAKDIGSAAVLLCVFIVILIWGGFLLKFLTG